MLLDGPNFNNRIDDNLTLRLCRLIDEITPCAAEEGKFDAALRDLFKYPPLRRDGGLQPPPRDPSDLAIIAIAAIYAGLREAAEPYRLPPDAPSGSGTITMIVGPIQEMLDQTENRWRRLLDLPLLESPKQ